MYRLNINRFGHMFVNVIIINKTNFDALNVYENSVV